ncbi:GDSL-type esterase/lipase family protein [Spirillospora sp. NPDC048911]|uniref:GDSL-type esterase/lipase family protein n=1 Tax=Spirillospora sp. NPDC048911 TaxID=3364527 RepID=UPI0037108DC2
MAWPIYVALGDSLGAGRDADAWPARLARTLAERTGRSCVLTDLSADRAEVADVIDGQFPAVPALRPDLISVTVGMTDIRDPEFEECRFGSDVKWLFDGLAAMTATLLTCTLPDIADRLPIPAVLVPMVHDRMRVAGEAIRAEAAAHGALCVDAWRLPGLAGRANFSDDRVHLSPHGHQTLADTFADLLTG